MHKDIEIFVCLFVVFLTAQRNIKSEKNIKSFKKIYCSRIKKSFFSFPSYYLLALCYLTFQSVSIEQNRNFLPFIFAHIIPAHGNFNANIKLKSEQSIDRDKEFMQINTDSVNESTAVVNSSTTVN
jgi:hypothetical protein